MAYNGQYFKFNDFSGGAVTAAAPMHLKSNESTWVRDIIIGPKGSYIRSRDGYAEGNATEYGSLDTWPTQGVGRFLTTSGTEYVITVREGKVYSSIFSKFRQGLTFSDITGAFAGIASGANAAAALSFHKTTILTFNDLAIGFGGSFAAPDTPFKWTGSGNISALGGSPPAACKVFSVNNRVFAYGNSAINPQRISWCVLGNVEDWTGTGSGSAEVGGLEDGEPILGHAVLSNNIVLLFKQNSIYQMVVSEAPFSIQLLFNGVGAVSPDSIVVYNGRAYFVSPERQVVFTDGNELGSLPSSISNAFYYLDSISQYTTTNSRSCFGYHLEGRDFNWLVWTFGNSQTQQVAWDIDNSCWVDAGFYDTGVNNPPLAIGALTPISCGESFSGGVFYGGSFNSGKVFQPDYLALGSDDDGTPVFGNWISPWLNLQSPDGIVQANKMIMENDAKSGQTIRATVRYDFSSTLSYAYVPSISPIATENLTAKTVRLTGRGNYMQVSIEITPASGNFYGFTLGGKSYGQKKQTSP